jgi:hypothetical protein
MANLHLLTKKILKAIRIKYQQQVLYAEEQKISERTGRVYTEYRLNLCVSAEKYNEINPDNPLNPKIHKSTLATIPLKRSVKIEEIFLYLLNEIWKKLESGEMYEQGERAREKIRSRRGVGRGKRAYCSTGVLQDALTGEELPGGISGSECGDGAGESQGDIGEA